MLSLQFGNIDVQKYDTVIFPSSRFSNCRSLLSIPDTNTDDRCKTVVCEMSYRCFTLLRKSGLGERIMADRKDLRP
jgi:hypothetical protein